MGTKPIRVSDDTYNHILYVKGKIEMKANRIVKIDEVVHGVFYQMVAEIEKGNDIGLEMLVNGSSSSKHQGK